VNAAEADPVGAVRDLTGGGPDYAFEAVGSERAIQQAWQAAVADIPLDDYAKNHPELAASIAKFSDGKDA